MTILTLQHLTLHFGARTLFADVNLLIDDGDRIGLIGPNGSGKTTLLKVIGGTQAVDEGKLTLRHHARVGWLSQDLDIVEQKPLIDFVTGSVKERAPLEASLAQVTEAYAKAEAAYRSSNTKAHEDKLMELATELSTLHMQIADMESQFSPFEAKKILSGLGFKESDMTRSIQEFSGGWKMRAVLCALLFQKPDLLLLDEPTNHLDMPTTLWFSDFLKQYSKAFVLITHDREFLNEQIQKVVSIEPEGVRTYKGNHDAYLLQRAEEATILENKAKNLEREREQTQAFIERFRAQATKAKAVQSRVRALDRMEDVTLYQKRKTLSFRFPEVKRSGNDVLTVSNLSHAFGNHEVLKHVNLAAYRGDRVAILGPNGAGKTTLLKIITGELAPTSGNITFGHNVEVAYYAQHHTEILHPKMSIFQELSHSTPHGPTFIRSVLGMFLFSGDDVDKTIAVLSGGEKARVALAKIMTRPMNCLLLDEPTNHLDLDSCEALIESMDSFAGTMFFVSHNRALVRKLANKVWEVDDKTVTEYVGDFETYLRMKQGRALPPPPVAVPVTQPTSSKPVAPVKKQTTAQKKLQEKLNKLEAEIKDTESKQAELHTLLAGNLNTEERITNVAKLKEIEISLAHLQQAWESCYMELEAH